MTGKSAVPRPPAGLAARGRALWRATQRSYVLDPVETQLLRELCTVVDRCDQIRAELKGERLTVLGSAGQYRAHPLLAALESQQKLADRLASSLGVSMPGASGAGHARKAARTRWSRAAKAATVTPIRGGT